MEHLSTVTLLANRILVSISGRATSTPIQTIKKWGKETPGLWEHELDSNPLSSSEISRAITVALRYLEYHSHIIIDWENGHVHPNRAEWFLDWNLEENEEIHSWHLTGVRPGIIPDELQTEEILVEDDRELRNIRTCKVVIKLPDLIQASGDLPDWIDAVVPSDSVPAAWRLISSLSENAAEELFQELEGEITEVNEVKSEFTSGQFFDVGYGRYIDFSSLCERHNREIEDFKDLWIMRRRFEERSRSYVLSLRRLTEITEDFIKFDNIDIKKDSRNWIQYKILADEIDSFVFEPDQNQVSHLITLELPMAIRRALVATSGLEPEKILRDSRYWHRYQNIHALLAITMAGMLSVGMTDMFPGGLNNDS